MAMGGQPYLPLFKQLPTGFMWNLNDISGELVVQPVYYPTKATWNAGVTSVSVWRSSAGSALYFWDSSYADAV